MEKKVKAEKMSEEEKKKVTEYQRQMNPRISKPVGHIALSFLPEDKDKLTDEMMTKIAREYMELMGIKNTQFLLVRHFDRSNSVRLLPTGRKNGNPHCHLVYNRINNEGKTISDQNDFRRFLHFFCPKRLLFQKFLYLCTRKK